MLEFHLYIINSRACVYISIQFIIYSLYETCDDDFLKWKPPFVKEEIIILFSFAIVAKNYIIFIIVNIVKFMKFLFVFVGKLLYWQ